MSAVKRKQQTSNAPNTAKKRQKIDSKEHGTVSAKPEARAKDGPTAQSQLPHKSLLSKEQPAFPRGGAGPLTLLEKKQIRVQATRDVAREAEQSDLFATKTADHTASEDSDLDLEGVATNQTFAAKKTKKQKQKQKKGETSGHGDTIHIESISSKRLTTESLLLGRISEISSKELTISLPNNLIGFVSLTAISQQFTLNLEKSFVQTPDEEEGDDDDEAEDNNTDLHKLFSIGQALRVAVRDTANAQDKKQELGKRINLSIEPSVVNRGLSRKLLATGIAVQAAVISVEDHGAIVDMGFEDGTTAFISRTALPTGSVLDDLRTGAVMLCAVKSTSSKGKAVQLSPDLSNNSIAKSTAPVDAYLPGTVVEVLLTQVTEEGLAGKLLGLVDVTADALQSGAFRNKEAFTAKYAVGQKVVGRLIANFPQSDTKKLAFSILDPMLHLRATVEDRFALSSVIERASIISIVHGLGVYVSLPSQAVGFVHISRLSDKRVDTLSEISGPFKPGTEHQARVLDYNYTDDLYILSLQKCIIEQPFLRLSDVQPATIVKGTVEKILVGPDGVRGLLVKLSPGITGHVSLLHLSDTVLKSPEKKYREGQTVKARVLSVDVDKRRLDLTLKKALINSDQPVWSSYDSLELGQSTVGTLIKVEPNGAIIQFFGNVKGRLPVSEMSEAFIKDATEHFSTGQVLTVHILKVDSELQRITLTARDPTSIRENHTSTLKSGTIVSGTVFEKSADDLTLRIEPNGAIGRLSLDHVADGSERKRKSALEKIRVGQKLEGVLILELKGRQVILSNKASLRTAAEDGTLLTGFEALAENKVVTGYVSNITAGKVFVRFAQGITGVINKAQLPDDQADIPDFGLKYLQAVSARIINIDFKGAEPRFWLSMRTSGSAPDVQAQSKNEEQPTKEIVDPVDGNVTAYTDFVAGAVVDARITSVKDTQINVELAKGIQGRVDVSEVFDDVEQIHDHKRPLRQFSTKQILKVKILGQHDSRTYKFLPLSHRSSKNVVFELSARASVVSGESAPILGLEDIELNTWHSVFVNNITDHSLMVNVSPAVRGRIKASDVSDDLGLAANLTRNFPIGSVIRAKVITLDAPRNRLDLSAKTGAPSKVLTVENIGSGDIVAGRITKITDRSLLIQLSDTLVGAVDLVDMADDFELADPTRFEKNEIVRAYVLQVDQPNKKVHLSLRASKILSSGLEIKDPERTLENLHIGDTCRGFVANVSEKGIFITLSRSLTAFVRVTNLSDEFLKEWKDQFQRDQLVQGKVIALDKDSGHVQMSLRKSHVDGTYRPLVTFIDLKVGDVVTGKIAKVETFGVFIVVDHSENVRGLCHRSEIAEQRIEDVTKLGFSEGDLVKAKVLKVEPDKRRVNFGLKASYFDGEIEDDDSVSGESRGSQDLSGDEEEEDDDDNGDSGMELELATILQTHESIQSEIDNESIMSENDNMELDEKPESSKGLSVGGFDWFGMPSYPTTSTPFVDVSDGERDGLPSKKKKKKPEILVDRTGDLDKDGPQSVDDFERLLLTEPDNAQLWVQFMAFHIDLGDTDVARDIAEKALKSIGIAQEREKQTIWVALLNIENTFGDDDSVEATLQRACQTMDAEDMHNKLASIYIQSGKHGKADELFQTMTKKFTQDPKLWVNYATFLFDTLQDPAKARMLLPRALQALPPFSHFDITSKFAQLEFKTKTGVPEEGRTRFQGLINLYPKRLDLFNIMVDLEMKVGDADSVRAVFEQVLSKNLKPAKVKPFFQRWLAYEKKQGDLKRVQEVEAKAANWVTQYQKSSEIAK